jgi:Sec-independent protein secretion pathway component TatC
MVFAYFVVFPLVFGFLTSAAPEGVTLAKGVIAKKTTNTLSTTRNKRLRNSIRWEINGSTLLFALGMVFAYFVVFPLVFGFLTSAAPEGVTVKILQHYLAIRLRLAFLTNKRENNRPASNNNQIGTASKV